MTLLEILLIIIGVIAIIISCFMVEKPNKKGSEIQKKELTEEELKQIKGKIDTMVSIAVEETINQTDDKLSKISNEKIIAVDEFSNQVIEKISHNHDEVVFLYNMLTEKEAELKDSFKSAEKKMQEIQEQELKGGLRNNKDNELKESTVKNSIIPEKRELNQSMQIIKKQEPGNTENNNIKIIELYKQGKSIVDISKLLDLGQGEVKLVVDLYIK